MGDIALVFDPSTGTVDLAMAEDDLASDEGMQTAVLLSLFCDARAEPEDALPAGTSDRRGWLGDDLAENEGDRIGSRRWLVLDRGKNTPDLAPQLEKYDREALQWLVADGVATAVNVNVEVAGTVLRELVTIDRPAKPTLSFRFDHVWNAEAAAHAL